MSKRPNLAAALHEAGAKPALSSVPPAAPKAKAEPKPEIEAAASSRAPSREGLKAVTCYVKPEAHKQLRMLGLEQGANVQELMVEAMNDLFRKHGRAGIA